MLSSSLLASGKIKLFTNSYIEFYVGIFSYLSQDSQGFFFFFFGLLSQRTLWRHFVNFKPNISTAKATFLTLGTKKGEKNLKYEKDSLTIFPCQFWMFFTVRLMFVLWPALKHEPSRFGHLITGLPKTPNTSYLEEFWRYWIKRGSFL